MKQSILLLATTILITLFSITMIHAAELSVPAEYTTIQMAIDSADDGDTVLVADGTYSGTGNIIIDFRGKAITLISEHGAESCVIDCDYNGCGFYFHSGENSTSVVQGFTITKGSGYRGGGIHCHGASPLIQDCIITDNIAQLRGAGVYCTNGSSPEIKRCTITRNLLTAICGRGSGILCKIDSHPIVTDCVISNNTSHCNESDGGGIACISESSAKVVNCTITNNSVTGPGGGILCIDSTLTATGCIISDNLAIHTTQGDGGGGVWGENSVLQLSDCTISGNTAQDYGGGLTCHEGTLEMSHCTITSNVIDASGGGIHCRNSNVKILHSQISGNVTRDHEGGGIYCGYTNLELSNCLIAGNSSLQSGGGIYSFRSNPSIKQCTIAKNNSQSNGGGIYLSEGNGTTLTNCIVWENSPDQIQAVDIIPEVTFCDVENGWAGEGNIDEDPLFTHGVHGNFYLSQTIAGQTDNSPCVNTGSDLAENIGFTTLSETTYMNELVTRTDQIADAGQVDMGYHYFPVSQMPLGVQLNMSSQEFLPGDEFELTATLSNPGPDILPSANFVLLLEVYNQYVWYPTWTEEFSCETVDVACGSVSREIFSFLWPDIESSGNATFIGAILNQDLSYIHGNWDSISFDWSQE